MSLRALFCTCFYSGIHPCASPIFALLGGTSVERSLNSPQTHPKTSPSYSPNSSQPHAWIGRNLHEKALNTIKRTLFYAKSLRRLFPKGLIFKEANGNFCCRNAPQIRTVSRGGQAGKCEEKLQKLSLKFRIHAALRQNPNSQAQQGSKRGVPFCRPVFTRIWSVQNYTGSTRHRAFIVSLASRPSRPHIPAA